MSRLWASLRHAAVAVCTVVAILAVTFAAARGLHRRDEGIARRDSQQQVRHALSVLDQATSAPLRALAQVARTVTILRSPIGERWPAISGLALQEDTVHSIGYVDRVPAGRLRAFERDHHLRVRVATPLGSFPASPAREHVVLSHLLLRNHAHPNLGVAVEGDARRRSAYVAAAMTGRPRATPPVPYFNDPLHRRGIVFFFPVYRAGAPLRTPQQRLAAARGWVFGSFELGELMRGIRSRLPAGVRIDVLDDGWPIDDHRVVRHAGSRTTYVVGGRRWTVILSVPGAGTDGLPGMVTTIGVALALLAALAFWLTDRRERYALALVAERMSERDAVEGELRRERDHTAALMRSIADGVVSMDPDGYIVEVNTRFEDMVGYRADELIGLHAPFPFWPHEDVDRHMDLRASVRAGSELDAELTFVRRDGTRFPVLLSAAIARAADGAHIGFVCTAKDISERKRHEEQLALLAAHDALTGLLNHRSFQEHLHAEVARADRQARPISLVLLDLDRFKRVNDLLGHPVGDRVLAEVAERLRDLVRSGEWLARIGGEEFAWILTDTDAAGAYAAAERARQAVAATPFGEAGPITLSAGVCDLGEATNADDLYRLADVALYWAKSHGRNMTFRYSAAVAGELGERETPAEVERRHTVRTLHSLVAVVEAKDVASTGHTDRVAELAHRLAVTAGWPHERANRLREAALLHDVGKVALRGEVLAKPGALTEEEYEHVKTHSAVGARMVASVLDAEQTAWVRQHHERWDGRGYPDGLRGSEISDGGALLAMADAFDAMTSPRAYKPAMTIDEALHEAHVNAGRQFAPEAVQHLLASLSPRSGRAAV